MRESWTRLSRMSKSSGVGANRNVSPEMSTMRRKEARFLARNNPVDLQVAGSAGDHLFDEAGKPLTPYFPNRTEKKILGLRVSSDPGPYELAPATDDEALEQALVRVRDDLRHLRARRAR